MKRIALLGACVALLGAAAPARAQSTATPPCQNIAVTMPDGVKLDGWFRPKTGGGRAPVLWTMTPYGNDSCPTSVGGIDNDLAQRFNVVRLSYRGTGASEGVADEWGPQTRKDVLDVGNWIVEQPWADGLVPTGASAEGAWITYALEHPAVIAAVWQMSCADPLRGCIRTGGTLAGGILALTEGDLSGYASGLPRRIQNGNATNPDPAEQIADQTPDIAHAYSDDTYTDFWKQRLGLQYLQRIHAPVMYTTDLYDFVPEGMYVAYENTAPRYRWLDLGFGHNSSAAETTEGTKLHGLVEAPIKRFLEHYALGANNGFQRDPRMTLVTNLGTVSGYEQGNVLVRSERGWPLPETRWTRLHLGDSGALSTAPPKTEGTDTTPLATVAGPKGELRTVLSVMGAVGPAADPARQAWDDDLRPDEATALTYTTAPLRQNVELSGPIVLRAFASSTASDFDWQVRLTDVHPDGRSTWISDGQLRASLRAIDPKRSRRTPSGDIIRPWYTFAQHDPVPTGQVVEYLVELAPTSNVFAAGDRVRVDLQPVAEGYADSARTGGAGVLQVLHGAGHDSSILLPLVPHRCQHGVPGSTGVQVPSDCAGSF